MTNNQCRSYCNMLVSVCNNVHSTGANRGLKLVVHAAIEPLLSYWMKYMLDINSSELECSGCATFITMLF